MLAVSSLSTYGILLAGWVLFNILRTLFHILSLNIRHYLLSLLVSWCIIFFFCLLFLCLISYLQIFNVIILGGYEADIDNLEYLTTLTGGTPGRGGPLISYMKFTFENYHFQMNRGTSVIISHKIKANLKVKNTQIRRVQTTKSLKSINCSDRSLSNEDIKSLHQSFIKELYKDRNAPVIPFNKESILATCYNCLDKTIRSEFLKQWGSKSCIYLIEYKHDPHVYYIGKTTLFKRRFNNHLKADSGSKFHIFLNLIGWEHFNVSIIEECSLEVMGARENFYLQKYLPLLNSVFSSSITETAIYSTLKDKLDTLRVSKSTPTSKNIPIYVYDIDDKGINKAFVLFKSMSEASLSLGINIASINQYRNTSIPYRGKLFYTEPITDFNQVFSSSKLNTPSGLVNKVVAIKVWCYDAKTLELIKGSPFDSKVKASKALGIRRSVIDYFLDTGKAEGVIGTYLYSRPLSDKEIKNLLQASENLQLGNKIKVWAYNAQTLELINNSPFYSLLDAASYFNINYRTITRHLDTKIATLQNKTLVYFFKKEIDSKLITELSNGRPALASYTRSEIWGPL